MIIVWKDPFLLKVCLYIIIPTKYINNSYFSLLFFVVVEVSVFKDLEMLDLRYNQLMNGSLTVKDREIKEDFILI